MNEGQDMNNAIITVVGKDKVGIIARVSVFLAERNINIDEISQTVLSGKFVMMMSVDTSACEKNLADVNAELQSLADDEGVVISMLHEKVFGAMHRI
jgi:ACT domain-containing protein